MLASLRPLLVVSSALLVLTTLVYPGVVTAGAQVLFSHAANGSVIERDGRVVGSSLIGQTFAEPAAHPEYLWGRPSVATNDKDTGLTVSAGSNYGPSNPALRNDVTGRVTMLRDAGVEGVVPIDLVTASASGLDPDITVAAADVQLVRIARARHVDVARVQAIVDRHAEGRGALGLGEPRVNVLTVNLALDAELTVQR